MSPPERAALVAEGEAHCVASRSVYSPRTKISGLAWALGRWRLYTAPGARHIVTSTAPRPLSRLPENPAARCSRLVHRESNSSTNAWPILSDDAAEPASRVSLIGRQTFGQSCACYLVDVPRSRTEGFRNNPAGAETPHVSLPPRPLGQPPSPRRDTSTRTLFPSFVELNEELLRYRPNSRPPSRPLAHKLLRLRPRLFPCAPASSSCRFYQFSPCHPPLYLYHIGLWNATARIMKDTTRQRLYTTTTSLSLFPRQAAHVLGRRLRLFLGNRLAQLVLMMKRTAECEFCGSLPRIGKGVCPSPRWGRAVALLSIARAVALERVWDMKQRPGRSSVLAGRVSFVVDSVRGCTMRMSCILHRVSESQIRTREQERGRPRR
ncbi:hypothetical protein C8Q70DRAFT_57656 [Cubamyces menziesii]|nr:hypothetical protein C8Q70DRAFT_57656 [Cubamyces menziesii]